MRDAHQPARPVARPNPFVQAQQQWRTVVAACRESGATLHDCLASLGSAMSKLGAAKQQLLAAGGGTDAIDEVRSLARAAARWQQSHRRRRELWLLIPCCVGCMLLCRRVMVPAGGLAHHPARVAAL